MSQLACGRCRLATAEPVTKLCAACALPLHASCAEDAAARDCGLSPTALASSTAYCSRNCYEADTRRPTNVSTTSTPSTSMPSHQVPSEVTAALTVKIGDVTRTSRKQLAVVRFPFLLAEGFDVFRAKANSRTAKELQAFRGERHVREDPAVYIRPGAHSKQAELVELSERNFEARVARSYRNFLKRKPGGSDPFECEIVTYVKKDAPGRRPRSSAAHSASVNSSSGSSGSGNALTHPSVRPPAFQHGYSSTSELNLDGADVAGMTITGGKRKRALPSPPRVGGELPAASLVELPHEGDGFKTVRMVLNGSVVPVRVNVRDLLACFAVAAPPQTQAQAPTGGSELGAGSTDDALHGAGAGVLPPDALH